MFIDDLIESQMEPAHYAELGFSAKRSFISWEDKGISVKRQFKAVQSVAWQCADLSITTLPSSSSGHEDCLELLLEHSPFSYLEGNPFTPLHCAV